MRTCRHYASHSNVKGDRGSDGRLYVETKPLEGLFVITSLKSRVTRFTSSPPVAQITGANMANLIVSYDLNGPRPTHKQMDDHLNALGPTFVRGRILETVWYVGGPTNATALRGYIQQILSHNDLLIVAEVSGAAWTKLLVDTAQFKATFERNQHRLAA